MLIAINILLFLYMFMFAKDAHAIVILPAILLIPLVKLVALVVGTLSIPIASFGVMFGKITKQYTLTIAISFLLIILTAIIAAVILRQTHPANPWL